MRNKAKTNPFSNASVMLAKQADKVPDGDEWLFEMKYDGYRILAFVEAHSVRLVSRNGHDYTHRFPTIADSLGKFFGAQCLILDGEMVVVDRSGRTDFSALQAHMTTKSDEGTLCYIIFDLLAIGGEDIRLRPLLERKALLAQIMDGAPTLLHFSKHVRGHGEQCLKVASEGGFEGIVAKRANSPYVSHRNGDWVKIKFKASDEFIICGYCLSERKAGAIGSLILGRYDGDELIYVGKVGSGITAPNSAQMLQKFHPLTIKESPFAQPIRTREEIVWLNPLYLADVHYSELTAANKLRHPTFKGIRLDKINQRVHNQIKIGQSKHD